MYVSAVEMIKYSNKLNVRRKTLSATKMIEMIWCFVFTFNSKMKVLGSHVYEHFKNLE